VIAETQENAMQPHGVLTALQTMAGRVGHVVRLDATVFQEIAWDRVATLQALIIVLLAGTATVVGTMDEEGVGALGTLPRQLFLAYIGWITGTILVHLLGTRLLRSPDTSVEWAAVARVMGYAYAPVLLRVIGVFPDIGLATAVLTLVWQGIAILAGIKEVFGYKSYWKPLGIMAIGSVPYVAVVAGFNLLLN
jgi:hypothetical protein